MNYITTINSFWNLATINPLSTGQVALFFALLHLNNNSYWTEWFQAPNQVLSVLTGMSRSGILKARNELKQKGYIDFRERGTKTTLYRLTIANSTQESVQDSKHNGKQIGMQDSKQISEQYIKEINKDKNKDKNKEKTPPISPAVSMGAPEKSKGKIETMEQIFERLLPDYPISEGLSDKLREWIKYKRERKDSYKEQGMKSLLSQVSRHNASHGDTAVCNLIDLCMSNGWKGIIWDKLSGQGHYGRVGNRVSEVDNW